MTLNGPANPGPPSLEEIRQQTSNTFHVRPCLWQLKVVEAILRGEKHIISIAGTGMGKTLTFWMPLLFRPPSNVIIVVTPLNGLGKQNVASLDEAGLKSIFICGDTATAENFRVSEQLFSNGYLLTLILCRALKSFSFRSLLSVLSS
jgi:superfamily II DNA helicase RecQ